MPIETLVFDVGRTLIPFSFDPVEAELLACRDEAFALAAALEKGRIEAVTFQSAMCRLTGMAPEAFAPWWNSILQLELLVPEEWIDGLMNRYRVGVLSNTNSIHFAHLRQQVPLLRRFEFYSLSYEVGAAKPEPDVYEDVERKAGCAPGRILYFDDVPEFVEVARARGWQAEVFRGAESLSGTLAGHGIVL